MKENARLIYHIIALIVVVIWGSTFVFTKLLLLSGLTAAQVFLLRFLIAYSMLLVFSLSRKNHRWFSNSLRDELLMVGLGITGGSVYFLAENMALTYTTTTNTSLIVCLCPLFAALLISLFYKSERLRPIQVAGSLMAAVGVVIVVLNGRFVLHLSPVGDALAFTACMCWALYSLLLIPANKRYDALFITRKTFFYGILTILPYFIYRPEMPPMATLTRPDVLLNILFLGCVASMLCYLTWTWVIEKLGAVIATNYVYFNPVITIICAWWILSETITVYFLMGTSLILIGMYLADKHKTPKI